MPLKIVCSNCGKVLISKFLKKGDTIFCKHCDKETLIDDKAVLVSDEEAEEVLSQEKEFDKIVEISSDDQRFEYKFVELKIERNFFSSQLPGEYVKIIESNAKQGWRFVQIFPIAYLGEHPSVFQLVFEKEIERA